MKNIKFILFIICLVFFLNVIFFNCSFATLYILKNQEGKDIWITNQENIVSKYEKLGYVIWILKARGLSQKSPDPESIPNEAQSQLETESINSEPQTKVVLPPTTKPITTNTNRDKMIEIFKTNALKEWGNDSRMVNYEVNKQTEAYDWVIKQTKYPDIIERAKQEWANDYAMVKYEYEKQVRAYEWLERNKAKNPEAFKRASNKWGNDYVMVKYEYEKEI
jgi:hypothetical protein